MMPGHPYGTPLGLLAMLGYIGWMVAVFIFVVFGCTIGAGIGTGMETGTPYSIAVGMGVWQLIIILWGSGRILYPVPIHRSIEFPVDYERPLSPAPDTTPRVGANSDSRVPLP